MPNTKTIASGITTRLKKRQRGFHFDKEPGFFAVNKSFGDAAAKTANEVHQRALKTVAEKYALLDESGEPVEALAKLFAQSNFGYGDEPMQTKRTGEPLWGSSMGMPSDAGDRVGLSRNLSYGGV